MTLTVSYQNALGATVTLDLIPYTAYQGFKWMGSDIDAPDSGRTMDAKMHRGRVATKVRLDITCRPLTLAEASTVLTAIMPEWVSVTYTDPQLGMDITKTMYSNNRPAAYMQKKQDGREYWNGISFPLIEQ